MNIMTSIDEITRMMTNPSLREELPDSYTGELECEFNTIVALFTLTFTSLSCQKNFMAQFLYSNIRKFIHETNNLYFSMKNEQASRIDEDDLDLAKLHALQEIPENNHDDNIVMMDLESLHRTIKATSNICVETQNHLDFIVSEFRSKHRITHKEECKKTYRCFQKTNEILQKIIHYLDRDVSLRQLCVDTSEFGYSELSISEQQRLGRKSRRR